MSVPEIFEPESLQKAQRNDSLSAAVIAFPPAHSTAAPRVRRRLTPTSGRALETLGHAIEYLADEYAAAKDEKGPLGSADPRVEAIQILKQLNREVYYSGTEEPARISRIRRWFLREKA